MWSARGTVPTVVNESPKSIVPSISANEHQAVQRRQGVKRNSEPDECGVGRRTVCGRQIPVLGPCPLAGLTAKGCCVEPPSEIEPLSPPRQINPICLDIVRGGADRPVPKYNVRILCFPCGGGRTGCANTRVLAMEMPGLG